MSVSHKRVRVVLATTAIAAMTIVGLTSQTAAGAAAGTVSATPVSYTPWLLSSTPNQQVRQLTPCGSLMYAVGTITAIGQSSNRYTRSNAFSFSATTGAVTSWAPQVNGTVNSIALSPDCTTAYLGGAFTTINGTAASHIAAVDATTGAVKTGFTRNAAGQVFTVQYTHGQVLVGGNFLNINGASRTLLASLNPTTGAVTSYLNVNIQGTYPSAGRKIHNSALSHSGSKILIEGVFTSINGQPRQQIAMLDLDGTTVALDGWRATELERPCAPIESFFARDANWSPDDQTVYTATTGYKPASGPGSLNSQPRSGLCDAAAAFPATASTVTSKWINYTGCDSYYSVAADDQNVYVSGHERWANNGFACDSKGPGALDRPGIASIGTATGLATAWNPTRALGKGSDDLVLTTAGLWVASDNWSDGFAQKCGGLTNHGGICFFPY